MKTNNSKVTQPLFWEGYIQDLLQKMFNDFNMIDCKMKEILNSESIEKEGLQDIAKKLNEANIELNQCAEIRNKKIDELLKMIKN